MENQKSFLTFEKKTRNFLSGAIAGSAATIATYPLDLLRTRFAAQGNDKVITYFNVQNIDCFQVYRGIISACRQIHSQEGFRGFYRGLYPALLQIIPYMGVMFSTQEYLSNTITNWGIHHFNGGETQHQFWKQTGGFVGGGIAGIVSKTVVMPFDVIRKRLQVQGPSRHRYVFTKIHQP